MVDGDVAKCMICSGSGGTLEKLTSNQGETAYAHELCILREQNNQLASELSLHKRLLAGLIAHCGNEVKVTKEEFQKAAAVQNEVELRPSPLGFMEMRLKVIITKPPLVLVPR